MNQSCDDQTEAGGIEKMFPLEDMDGRESAEDEQQVRDLADLLISDDDNRAPTDTTSQRPTGPQPTGSEAGLELEALLKQHTANCAEVEALLAQPEVEFAVRMVRVEMALAQRAHNGARGWRTGTRGTRKKTGGSRRLKRSSRNPPGRD